MVVEVFNVMHVPDSHSARAGSGEGTQDAAVAGNHADLHHYVEAGSNRRIDLCRHLLIQ